MANLCAEESWFRLKMDGTSDLICLKCLATIHKGQNVLDEGELALSHLCDVLFPQGGTAPSNA
jgi:hypothetical protein